MVTRTEITPKLSICMPTYNFGRFIGHTLDSILPQLNAHTELVILDSNSQDDTESICKSRIEKHPDLLIRYIKTESRRGIDRDIETVVNASAGEYVWLFSADDHMSPDSLAKIFTHLTSDQDIYICEHLMCDFHFKNGIPHPVFHDMTAVQDFDFDQVHDKKKYFERARTSEAFFSFLSTPVFKKSVWNRIETLPEDFYKTHWGLAGRLLLAVKHGARIRYLNERTLLKRGENDSFATQGEIHRIGISIKGFHLIANQVFGEKSFEAYHIRRVLTFEFPIKPMIMLKFKAYKDKRYSDIVHLNELVNILLVDVHPINLVKKILYKVSTGWLLYKTYRVLRFLKHDVVKKISLRKPA